ncbi:hypothetical protein GCM10027162_00990 [Streptomyces incanus]
MDEIFAEDQEEVGGEEQGEGDAVAWPKIVWPPVWPPEHDRNPLRTSVGGF